MRQYDTEVQKDSISLFNTITPDGGNLVKGVSKSFGGVEGSDPKTKNSWSLSPPQSRELQVPASAMGC